MPKKKHSSLEEARRLVIQLEYHFNEITYFHRLVEIAGDFERSEDIRLLLDAYLPYGKCRLVDIEQILELLKEATKQK